MKLAVIHQDENGNQVLIRRERTAIHIHYFHPQSGFCNEHFNCASEDDARDAIEYAQKRKRWFLKTYVENLKTNKNA